MIKWEYSVAFISFGNPDALATLNGLGADGWEMVSMENGWVLFKRPQIAPPPKEPRKRAPRKPKAASK